ncbi:histidine phosphatase family protein [Hoyosella sp. YIM 151337]|uniref:SixA phosphatase family protein n=1 Tax=Hoyosella sp. YIM 151337 TaxID=2992742 RepID=UPI0022355E55|nr:histidine phosphatase family protein [Hoyosella sp. YIM 151337]MCW4351930.1 histidine phosphatase family protein [Hoyosella sp. YIM 151337]
MEIRRTLILMRHGKSAYPLGAADYDRPLAPRGQREAALGGAWLQDRYPQIDQILCSSSARTRQTLGAADIDAPADYLDTLYGADAETILEEVSLVGDDIQTVLVIAHWPGIPETALHLAANDDGDAADRIRTKFPTSAIAVLSTARPWNALDRASAHLDTFHVPR